jgi:hypothetical protein
MVEREVRNIADFRSKEDCRPDTMLAPSEADAETLDPHPETEEDLHEHPRASKRGRWRWLIYLLLIALIGFGAWRFLAPKGQNERRTQAEAQPVGAAKVAVGDIDETLSGLGTVTPLATITVQTQREEGMDSREAIYHAAMMRFRPIMMTTSAALLGALPLCFTLGEGSELRQPLGFSIVGGLIVSQALTLYTTPIIYLYLDRLGLRLRPSRGARRRPTAAAIGSRPVGRAWKGSRRGAICSRESRRFKALRRHFHFPCRVVAGLLDDVQFDDLLLEQAQTPTREPLGRRRAGQGDQFRLRRPVENPRSGGVRIVFAGQSRLEPFLDEPTPDAADIVDAGVQRRRDRAFRSNRRPPPTRPPSTGCAPSSATAPDACPRRSSPPAAPAPRRSTSPHIS